MRRRVAKKLGFPVAPKIPGIARSPQSRRVKIRRAMADLRATGSGILTRRPSLAPQGIKKQARVGKGPRPKKKQLPKLQPLKGRRPTPFDRRALRKHGSLVGAR